MKNVIEVHHLTKNYGKHRGIEDINFEVEKGDMFGFLGPNGAGKSTTIRSILGQIHFQKGWARVLDYDVVKERNEMLAQVGYMPSEVMFYPTMKVSEIIKLSSDIRKKNCQEEAQRLCTRLEVDIEKRIQDLSLGNRKKVGIVCAMQHKPELLIFDEPTSGLDPLMQEVFFDLLEEYRNSGGTCFLSSHVLPEVKKFCKNVAIIREGKMIRVDSVENITKSSHRNIKIIGINGELPLLEGLTLVSSENEVKTFAYTGKMDKLIQNISNQSFKDILIEEPSLDEIFMHYYTEGEKK